MNSQHKPCAMNPLSPTQRALRVLGTLLLTVLALLLAPSPLIAAERKPDDLGILFVGGFQTKRAHFESYLMEFAETHTHVGYQDISSDMFNPDHLRDYAIVEQAMAKLQAKGASRIIAFGFSAGGKHVARLALRHSSVVAIGLLDPVDGGAPTPNEKTPPFLGPGDMIAKPSLLLASEYGSVPKIGGRACAPKDVGPDHFRAHIRPQDLIVDKTIPGASHVNFADKPWGMMLNMACNNGTVEHEPTQEAIRQDIAAFLEAIN